MDQYLKPGASLYRLIEEMQLYNGLVVAVDFDNTLYDFHQKGETYSNVVELLRELKALNCTIVCFTANEDEALVRKYFADNNIPLDLLNENPSFWKSDARKIYYNVLLDDRCGLRQVYDELKTVVAVENKRRLYQSETII